MYIISNIRIIYLYSYNHAYKRIDFTSFCVVLGVIGNAESLEYNELVGLET